MSECVVAARPRVTRVLGLLSWQPHSYDNGAGVCDGTAFLQLRSACSHAELSTIDLVGVVIVIEEVVGVAIAKGPLDLALAKAGVIQ